MATIREMRVYIPDELHKDFRWAVQVVGQNVQQGLFSAVEDFIAKVKAQVANNGM